jgi:hypothetical protein
VLARARAPFLFTSSPVAPRRKEVLLRTSHSLVFAACIGFVGCAYGTGSDGFGLGLSPITVADSGTDTAYAYDSGQGADTATPYDSGAPYDSATTFDTGRVEPPDTGTTCALSLPTGIPACDTCVSASCCAADNACGADPNCLNFDSCIATCEGFGPDSGVPRDGGLPADAGACLSACQAEYPTGASELAAIDDCISTSCAAACGGP